MKFARIVFIAGGVWGIAALAPFYWLVDITGRRYAAPMHYPQFFCSCSKASTFPRSATE